MVGTLVNTGTIIVGSVIGLIVHSRLSTKMSGIVIQGLGLVTMGIGISMSLESQNLILSVISIVAGAIIGQWIDIDQWLRNLSGFLEKRAKKSSVKSIDNDQPLTAESNAEAGRDVEDSKSRFTEAFITASMLFCVGSMAILGSIEDGMGNEPKLLITKSIMDGVAAVALASSLGIGVIFSALPVLIYQGAITLFATFIMNYMSPAMTANMTGVGGILLIGLAMSILKIKNMNVTNMLPSLIIVVVLSYFW